MLNIIAPSAPAASTDPAISRLETVFAAQKAAFLGDPYPSFAAREEQIRALVATVMRHRRAMKDALHSDFGWHPEPIADLIEILGIAGRADYVLGELPRWMADEQRAIDPATWGSAAASVRHQPKGVIGNMVPWNFPFDIAFGPLIDMLAAGNRVIIKPSDLGPASGALIETMIAETFDPDRVAVVNGGIDLARHFPTLRWDHLMFTGSPAIGRSVMAAAAANLVPVTLELGGKCPAIVARDAINADTVTNIVGMKSLKSGQVCVAPDHVYVPRADVERFVTLTQAHVAANLADYTTGPDATGMISKRHLDRILAMIDEARRAGCEVVQLEADAVTDPETRRTPLTLVIDPPADLAMLREEIFGPILPIIPYDEVDDVIVAINAGERPLALYVYADDEATIDRILTNTTSGGACVNLALLHGALAPLPFGGVGNSGMGRHHAIEGFREFSNPRGVFRRGSGGIIDAFNPPYRTLEAIVDQAFAST